MRGLRVGFRRLHRAGGAGCRGLRELQAREFIALAPAPQDVDELERAARVTGAANRARGRLDALVVDVAGRAFGTAENVALLEAAEDHPPPLLLRLLRRFNRLDAPLQALIDDVGG